MKTQSKLVLLLTVLCIGALLVSASTWKKKISEAGEVPVEKILLEKDVAQQAVVKISAENIVRLGSSLDEKTLDVLLSRQDAGGTVQLLVVGSKDMTAVGETFAKSVKEAYAGFIETDVATFNMTSARFVEEGLESDAIDWEKGYDIVLYEPFTWQNNGNVVIEQEHQHLLNVRQLAESHVADVSFLVTPPQPIYRAAYYLTQIQALATFTAAQDIPYIDHWENWPDTLSEELLGYVDVEGEPTDAGVVAWSDVLVRYFTGNEE